MCQRVHSERLLVGGAVIAVGARVFALGIPVLLLMSLELVHRVRDVRAFVTCNDFLNMFLLTILL